MSLFFKDPKTCANPWHGLAVIAFVCGAVTVALLIGKKRHELFLRQSRARPNMVAPADFNKPQGIRSDNRLRF